MPISNTLKTKISRPRLQMVLNFWRLNHKKKSTVCYSKDYHKNVYENYWWRLIRNILFNQSDFQIFFLCKTAFIGICHELFCKILNLIFKINWQMEHKKKKPKLQSKRLFMLNGFTFKSWGGEICALRWASKWGYITARQSA